VSVALGDDPAIEELIQRLVEALGPERIYLFGSRARGDGGPDSDYDLMVVVPGSELPGYAATSSLTARCAGWRWPRRSGMDQ